MSNPTTTFKLKEGLDYTLTSEEYHGIKGTYSSSQLKDLLENEEVFYEKYIAKSIPREENSAFDIGTYFHTSVLEPHKLKFECAVYKGIRRGKEWDAFKEKNAGKAIITESELKQAEGIVAAVKKSPVAMSFVDNGTPEVSCFAKILVHGGNIYAPTDKKLLGKYGWEDCAKIPKEGMELMIKVRADSLGEDFVLDLKSTTGNTKSPSLMKKKVSDLNYDLSASLYLDIFSLKVPKRLNKFIWTFSSKDIFNCKSYAASTNNVLVGRAKWKKAVLKLADCIERGWEIEDSLGTLEPQFYELEHIRERAEDLL